MDDDSDFLPNQSGKRVDNEGDDRISELPNEVLVKILSLLRVRRAASTTILSSRWLDLWKQIPDLKFNLESDRISQLPDQIISLILSKLRLKKAATTSVLSSRWLDSWKHTPNLDFDFDIVPNFGPRNSMCKYMEIVNTILESHKALFLKQFRISLLCENKPVKGAVMKWLEKCVEFISMRKVESLELYCSADRDNVVFGEPLREIYRNPRTLILFESLKSLELVSLEVSGEDIKLFLRNCPLLEVLEIHGVSFTSDIEVCGPSLKWLEICECSGGKSIKVFAPNLTFIKFDDDEVGKLLFENVPRLVHATFDIYTSEFIMHHFASAASFHISQLQFLRINLHDSKVFWTNAFPQMPNLKKLVISSTYNQSLHHVTRLIWASPRLEEFKFKFCGFFKAPTANMQEIENVVRSPHRHLKAFHLVLAGDEMGVEYHDHVVELVSYVSNNCSALHRIHIVGSAPRLLQTQLELPNHVQVSIRHRF